MNRSSGGFSLLELVLVLLILAVILAMTAPTFRGFAASRQVKDTAATMVTLIKWARMKAVSEGRPYRFNLDLDRLEFWLEAQVGANFEDLGVNLGQWFPIPEEIMVQWEDSSRAEQNGYLEFDPSGRSDPATIRLTGKLGTVLDVTCSAPTESFRVVRRPEEEYRYE